MDHLPAPSVFHRAENGRFQREPPFPYLYPDDRIWSAPAVPNGNVERDGYSPCGAKEKEQASLSQNLFPNHLSRNGLIEMEKRERIWVWCDP